MGNTEGPGRVDSRILTSQGEGFSTLADKKKEKKKIRKPLVSLDRKREKEILQKEGTKCVLIPFNTTRSMNAPEEKTRNRLDAAWIDKNGQRRPQRKGNSSPT